MTSFEATVSAICYSIIEERCSPAGTDQFPNNRVVNFVLNQIRRSPDYLRLPLKCLTVAFGWTAIARCGKRFHRVEHGKRWKQVQRWRLSRLAVKRDLIRFYESLAIFAWYSSVNDRSQ